MCKINEVIYQQILTAHYYWKNVIFLKELFAKEIIFVLKEITCVWKYNKIKFHVKIVIVAIFQPLC